METRVLLFWTKLFSTRPTFPGRGPVNRTDRQIYKEKTEQTRLTYRCPCVPGGTSAAPEDDVAASQLGVRTHLDGHKLPLTRL